MSDEAYIYDVVRTPRGRGKADGALHEVKPVTLLTTVLDAIRERNALDTAQVNDVVVGCVTPIGEQGADIARTAVLTAGWHESVAGVQINRFCASGLEAVNLAAAKVRSGWEDIVVAGGVESMSRVPMGSDGGALMEDPEIARRIGYVPQGIGADLIATLGGWSREDVDRYAVRSQERAARAWASGYFSRSIVPVRDRSGSLLLAQDEHIRKGTTLEALATLKPAFARVGEQGFDAIALRRYPDVARIEHVHTAGNSSGIVDGAALVLIGSARAARMLGREPRARIVATGLVGTEPTIMLTGPAPATHAALAKAGMTPEDIDLYEVNEAFAAVVLRFQRELAVPEDRLNVNGGAIAMGHPLGATGAMLIGTALDELERRGERTALVTLCVGGGMGIATIIERA
jgi:acetyl-CoA C-acetyltransferase